MKYTWCDTINSEEIEVWGSTMVDASLRIQKFYLIDRDITVLMKDMYCDYESHYGYIYDYEVNKC